MMSSFLLCNCFKEWIRCIVNRGRSKGFTNRYCCQQSSLVYATTRTFPAANLRLHFSSSSLLCFQLKDMVFVFSTSFCVHSFTYSCGACYIGQTTRRLTDRIRKHHPKWLHDGSNQTVWSSIVAHLGVNDHGVNVGVAFCHIFKVRMRQSRCIRYWILASA